MINCIICSGKTPIFLAAWKEYLTIIKELMSHGAEATNTDYNGWNMLHSTENAEIMKQFPSLINKGDCNGKYTIISGKGRIK